MCLKADFIKLVPLTGLPHTQGTQGIQWNSGNFQVEENLRESQGILIYFLNSEKLREVLMFSKKFREILRFLKF